MHPIKGKNHLFSLAQQAPGSSSQCEKSRGALGKIEVSVQMAVFAPPGKDGSLLNMRD